MLRLDRLLVGAAIVLVVAIAADAVRGHLRRRAAAPEPVAATTATPTTSQRTVRLPRDATSEMSDPDFATEAPVPYRIRLVPSTTAFLRNCPARSLRLLLRPGPTLALAYRGPPCHVPPLHLHAVVRDADGRLVYRGPALAREDLSGNVAGEHVAVAPLRVGCRTLPLYATVTGYGLSVDGPVRCRGAG